MQRTEINRTLSIAPMMNWTDRHCRFFHRLITRYSLLYTEMVTTGALIHGDRDRLLNYNAAEHPVALQLGGSEPKALAFCAKIAEEYGFDEVNLNVGCPSDRVQSGRFGACLMAEPQLVANCISEMSNAVSIPVTIKSRIGIDNQESYQELANFVSTIANAGCNTFIIHARKAWLNGLSPKQNREIPPLRYEMVHQIKQDFPDLEIIINGGIKTLDQVNNQLHFCDGVMIGREAYHNPYLLAEIDNRFYGATDKPRSGHNIIEEYIPYVREQLKLEVRLNTLTRHVLGLFHGVAGARAWRRYISENACQKNADENILLDALKFVRT